MSDKQYLESKPFAEETEPMTVHGYTLRRKLAVIFWLALWVSALIGTIVSFRLHDQFIEWYLVLDVRLMTDLHLGSYTHQTIIPLIEWARVIGFTLTVGLGIQVLRALFIPPPVREHFVRIQTFTSGEST